MMNGFNGFALRWTLDQQQERAKNNEIINEKKQGMDCEVIELKNKPSPCSNKVVGIIRDDKRIQELEIQLLEYSERLAWSDKEQQRLIELVDKGARDADLERQKVIKAQRESCQIYDVLQQANKCINDCLDVGNITAEDNQDLLEEVENIRTRMQELEFNTPSSSVDSCFGSEECSGKKILRIEIDLLNEEVAILKQNLQELTHVHKQDKEKHAKIYATVQQEFAKILSTLEEN